MSRGPRTLGELMAGNPWLIASKLGGISKVEKSDQGNGQMKAMDFKGVEGLVFPPHATEQFKEMVWASRQKRIKDISVKRIVRDLSMLIHRSLVEASAKRGGRAVSHDEVPELVRDIAGYLHRDFRLLSIADVGIAFREGINGSYGEYGGLYARTFYRWLRTYRQNRRDALRVQSRYEVDASRDTALQVSTPSEEALIQCLLREFREFEATGSFQVQDPGNVRYELLKDYGVLAFDKAQETSFLCQALKELGEGKERSASSRISDQDVTSRSRNIALECCFRQLKQRNSDLGTLIRKMRAGKKRRYVSD